MPAEGQIECNGVKGVEKSCEGWLSVGQRDPGLRVHVHVVVLQSHPPAGKNGGPTLSESPHFLMSVAMGYLLGVTGNLQCQAGQVCGWSTLAAEYSLELLAEGWETLSLSGLWT